MCRKPITRTNKRLFYFYNNNCTINEIGFNNTGSETKTLNNSNLQSITF